MCSQNEVLVGKAERNMAIEKLLS